MEKLVPIRNLFDAVYGVNLELLNLQECDPRDPDGIRFISRKESDNGLAAYVKRLEDVQPNPAHTISVAVSGSVLSSFYQDKEYYSGRDLYYLLPREKMSVEEMLFYAFCLRANKYKYNYGRAANRTLRDILVPSSMPSQFTQVAVSKILKPEALPILPIEIPLINESWMLFEIGDLFEIKKGKRLTKEDIEAGDTPFIGAIDSNNGYREFINKEPHHSGNTITVNYNGSVAEAFYQPVSFWASDDVNVLYPKFEMSVYVALFIATVIENEKYRFNFGRKWHVDRMATSGIYLPSKNNQPDFLFMERYMKSLPYSSSLSVKKMNLIANPATKSSKKNKALSDQELVIKYGDTIDKSFHSTIKNMVAEPSPTASYKTDKSHIKKVSKKAKQ